MTLNAIKKEVMSLPMEDRLQLAEIELLSGRADAPNDCADRG